MTVEGSSGRRILQCACGFEALNESRAVAGDRALAARSGPFLDRYLAWAADCRSRWQLLPPQGLATEVSALGEIIRLPAELASRCQDSVRIRRHHAGGLKAAPPPFGVDDLKSAVAKLSALVADDPRMIEVPPALERAFVQVGCDLASHLPAESLSDAEMALFFDGAERQPDGRFQPSQRRSIQDIAWLPTRLVGNRRFLSLGCVDPKASRIAGDVLSLLTADANEDLEAEESRRWFALRAVGRTLLRAYAEGSRTVISRHVPALFDSRRDRPHLTEPWILLGTEDGVWQVQWVWAKAPRLYGLG